MQHWDLLDAVQPAEGWFAVVGIKDGKPRQELVKTREEVDELIARYSAQNRDVYFGVAKYKGDDGRTKENVHSLQCFWLDIDCGPAKAKVNPSTGRPDGYIDQRAGFKALKTFRKTIGLPLPTVVDSGRGLHVYWPLTAPIPRHAWEHIAKRFKEVCRAQSFYVDDKVFEVARILRVPGTLNHKGSEPSEVSLVLEGTPIDVEEFKDILGVVGDAPPPRARSARSEAMEGSVRYRFSKIMRRTAKGDGCAQLKYIYENRDTVGYYEWFYALSVAAVCEDADRAVHVLSEGHPDYDPETLDEKVATIRSAASCSKFREHNPELCEGCPHAGKIIGPKYLGKHVPRGTGIKFLGETPEGEVVEKLAPFPIDYDLPFPYFIGKEGGVWCEGLTDSEGNKADPFAVYENSLFIKDILVDTGEQNTAVFELHLPMGQIKEFNIPTNEALDPTALRKALQSKGVYIWGKAIYPLLDYVGKCLGEIQHRKKETIMRQQFGWTPHFKSFVIGNREITIDGVRNSPPSRTTAPLAKYMTPKGSFQEWQRVWKLYDAPGMEPFAFAALTAFGSPLLPFLNQTGAVINLFSPGSGTGKTTVLNMINSVYGHPKELRLKKDDTLNGRLMWVGILNNLPPTMDEMTNMGAKEYSDMLYAMSNGKGKERMAANANELRENNTTWQSITVATSNAAFAEKLSIDKTSPEGELMRLIEYPIDKVQTVSTIEAKDLFDRVLFENYGHAGAIYARFLLENLEMVQDTCLQVQRDLDEQLGLDQKERFWSASGAANLSGGYIAKRAKIIDWDLPPIKRYFGELVLRLREQGPAPVSDVDQIITDFLNHNIQNLLVVDGHAPKGMSPMPKRTPNRDLLIRFEPDTQRMFVAAKAFRAYCVENQINYAMTVAMLEMQKYVLSKGNHRLARGTTIPAGPVYSLEFDTRMFGLNTGSLAKGPALPELEGDED